ncbi:MAG: DUF523 domain-containing protein [Sphaerochaetaceae bacterium]|nr:DUF523 domain-containing protein [Sphaerochaetaceae bacterium]MDC7237868.1 DUF523 domain-containing protein [Sphaerochaetaceae bacterium]
MNILISRCLLGFPCRYDGKAFKKESLNELINTYKNVHNFIAVCPEVESGMEVPRLPCEIVNDKVLNTAGEDKTEFFNKGARIACNKAKANNIKLAILKSNSPSCGVNFIYDGSFTNKIVEGSGITVRELTKLGVLVVTENDLDLIHDFLKSDLTIE